MANGKAGHPQARSLAWVDSGGRGTIPLDLPPGLPGLLGLLKLEATKEFHLWWCASVLSVVWLYLEGFEVAFNSKTARSHPFVQYDTVCPFFNKDNCIMPEQHKPKPTLTARLISGDKARRTEKNGGEGFLK